MSSRRAPTRPDSFISGNLEPWGGLLLTREIVFIAVWTLTGRDGPGRSDLGPSCLVEQHHR